MLKPKSIITQSRKVAKKSRSFSIIQDSNAVDSLCALCGFARDALL
jgi:hypothetical protein